MKDKDIEKFYSDTNPWLYQVFRALQNAPEEFHEEVLAEAFIGLAESYMDLLEKYQEAAIYLPPKPVIKSE